MATYQENTGGTLPFWNTQIENLLNKGQTLAGQQATTAGMPQQTVAGFTPQQQQAFGLASSSVGNYQPFLNASQQAIQASQAGAQFDPSKVSQFLNPYLSGVVQEIGRLGNEQFQNQILPGLSSNFSGLGQYGSARQAALMADAAARNQREVLGQQSQALNTGYQNAMNAYQDWANMGIGANQQAGTQFGNLAQVQQQLATGDIGNLATAGLTQQQQAQKQADLPFLNWQQQQTYPWQSLNNWANLFKAGVPQSSTSWNTSFKKGGLARFAQSNPFKRDAFSEGQKLFEHQEQRQLPRFAEGGHFDDDEEGFQMNEGLDRFEYERFAEGGMYDEESLLDKIRDKDMFNMSYDFVTQKYPELVDDPKFKRLAAKVALAESSGRSDAKGPVVPSGMHKGDQAFGMWQVMPKTAVQMGANLDDPISLNNAGLDYLATNYLLFDRNPQAAAVAHHAGPDAARRFIKTGSAGTRDAATGLSTDDYAQRVMPSTRVGTQAVPTQGEGYDVAASMRVPSELDAAVARATDPYYSAVNDVLAQRVALIDRMRNHPSLQPIEQGSVLGNMGLALMNAKPVEGSGLAGVLGAAGRAYYDREDALQETNKNRALARLALEEKLLPDVSQIKPPADWKAEKLDDGSVIAFNPRNPSQRMRLSGPVTKPTEYGFVVDPNTGDVIRTDKKTGNAEVAREGIGFKVPQGFMPERDQSSSGQSGVRPIPGSKEEREAQEARSAKEKQLFTMQDTANIGRELLAHKGRTTATGLSSVIDPRNYIPGTEAKDYQARLETFKSRGFLDQIEQMRGTGAISNAEGEVLRAAWDTLQTSQSDEAHERAIKRLVTTLDASAKRLAAKMGKSSSGATGSWDEGSTAKIDPLGIRK